MQKNWLMLWAEFWGLTEAQSPWVIKHEPTQHFFKNKMNSFKCKSPGWICAGRSLRVIHFLNSQVVAFQPQWLPGCLLSIFAKKKAWSTEQFLGVKFVRVVTINALAFLSRLGRWAFLWNSIPSLSRRKCIMSPLTESVMTKTITYTWRELLMISKHFHIWSFICCSYQNLWNK